MIKRLKFILACLFALQLPLHGANKLTISPYIVPIDYQNIQNKTDQTAYGAYAFLGRGLNHSFEADAGQLLNNSQEVLQNNLVAKYTYSGIPTTRLFLGIHAVSVDNDVNGGENLGDASVFWAGIAHDLYDYDNVYRAGSGLTIFHAEHLLSAGNITVTQISPFRESIFYLWKMPGTISSSTQVNYGFLSEEIGFGNKSFASISETITYTNHPWTLAVMTWAGEEQLATKENGFLITNIQEKHKAGASITLTYSLTQKLSTTAGYHYGVFEEVGRTEDSTFSKYVALLTYIL